MALSDYADWWDQNKRVSEAALTEWVQDNPQWWAVGIATGVQTSMDLGGGFVDVLRFGEGFAEGGFGGVGKDALRLLAIIGPLGRAGGMLSRIVHMRQIRLAVQVSGVQGPCAFQAVNNAISITKGKSLFLGVKDMAAAMGKPLGSFATNTRGRVIMSNSVEKMLTFLRSEGIRIKTYVHATTIPEAVAVAQSESGVVMFGIRCMTVTGKKIAHAVIAIRDTGGRVKFADYGGKYYNTLEDLVKGLNYGAVDAKGIFLKPNATIGVIDEIPFTGVLEEALALAKGAILVIEGMVAIETVEGVDLAVPVAVSATSAPTQKDPAPPEVVKASFQAFKARKQGKTVLEMPPLVITAGKKSAPRSDWLTGVQFRLNALGFAAGPVDGANGPRTDRAVRTFQKAYPPLAVDGIPGPRTQAKLVQICGY